MAFRESQRAWLDGFSVTMEISKWSDLQDTLSIRECRSGKLKSFLELGPLVMSFIPREVSEER